MSVSKKKIQRSQNQSCLSQVSNSQSLRDSSLFKNQYLVEIQNIHILEPNPQSQSQRKQQSEINSIKKKVTTQMKQQQGKIRQPCEKFKQNKVVNYTGLSKILDQRNILINNQQKQIECLKGSLDRVKRELQSTRLEFDKKILQDFASLKKQQKDNEENIKELQILRVGVRQLKNKVESLEHQKQLLQKKNTQYLQQNQQLTIKMTSLKQQYLGKIPDERMVLDLKNQLSVMKEQAKLTKQFQLQKTTLEERCRNFQKKINEYIIRYNQVQGDYNQAQIKYYRAQKQNDDLKMNVEELQIQNKNIRKMLEEQKKILSEQTERWKIRISRLEDHQKSDRNLNHLQTKIVINQIEDRCIRLEQLKGMEQKIQSKNTEIDNLMIKLASQTTQIQSFQKQISLLLKQNEEIKKKFQLINKNNAQSYRNKQNQLQTIIKSHQQYRISCLLEVNGLKEKIVVSQKQNINLTQNIRVLEEKLSTTLKQNDQNLIKKVKQTEQNSRKWSLMENQMRLKLQQLNKLSDEKTKYISSMMDKNTDLASDLRVLNDLISIKNKQIQQFQLNLKEKSRLCDSIDQQLKKRVKQVQYTKNLLAQKTKDMQIINSLLKQRIKEVEQLQSKVNKLNSELQYCQTRLKSNETQLFIKQSQLKRKQDQISEKNCIVLLRQSQKTNFFYELSSKAKQISDLQNISYQFKQQIRQLKTRLSQYKISIQEKQMMHLQKISSLQMKIISLQGKIKEQSIEIQSKNGQLSRKQTIIFNTNTQLRQIKLIVQEYKQKIQDCSNTIIQADRKLQSHQYLSKQNLLKLQQEIKYYRSKYEESFKESLQNSNKLHQIQRHLTQQINKNTELLKVNSHLQNQLSSFKINMQGKLTRQLQQLASQNKKMRTEASTKQVMLSNAHTRLKEYQNIGRQLQSKILLMTNQIIMIREQQQGHINKIKAEFIKNIQQKEHKHLEDIRSILQSQKFKHQKEINAQIERERHLGAKLQQAFKQILRKDNIIQQNYQIINAKQQELKSILKFRQSLESQQINKIKQYNIKLSQQIQQISQQYNQNYHQLRQSNDQCQKFKHTLAVLQKQNSILLIKNTQLIQEINKIKADNAHQSEENSRIITQMRCQIVNYQQKIKCQVQEISLWMQKNQMSQKQYKKIQNEVNKVNRSFLEQSNRRNRQSNRQIEAYKTQIQLLQDQNLNLQKVMDKQLGKRKIIIEQLISQKKMLYQQIGHH